MSGHSRAGGTGTGRAPAVASLTRTTLSALVLLLGYFALPMDNVDQAAALWLLGGLLLAGLVLAWQLREVTRSPYPRLRAVEALVMTLLLFTVVFATTYHVMSQSDPAQFSEPVDRLDGLYFTVTVFATVGFGDIVAVSDAGRAVVLLQMVGDLVLVGAVARVLVSAVKVGLEHRSATTDERSPIEHSPIEHSDTERSGTDLSG